MSIRLFVYIVPIHNNEPIKQFRHRQLIRNANTRKPCPIIHIMESFHLNSNRGSNFVSEHTPAHINVPDEVISRNK